MPYRSQVQQLDPELTLDGDELLVDREVRDGTSESSSLSMKDESSESDRFCLASWVVRASSVALSYWVLMTWRVSWGRWGRGAAMRDGETPRPFGIDCVLNRRESRFEDE